MCWGLMTGEVKGKMINGRLGMVKMLDLTDQCSGHRELQQLQCQVPGKMAARR